MYTIYDENMKKVNTQRIEVTEQKLASKYVKENDIVLELGARYGSVSCAINLILNNKKNQVVVEPDSRVWSALEYNRKINNCDFNIVKGTISNDKYSLTNLNLCFNGYGSTCVKDTNSTINNFSLHQVKEMYNIEKFSVLVADCEGFLETFLSENPEIYDTIRLLIFEADYKEKCNYNNIENELKLRNFKNLLKGDQNVWIRFIPFKENV